MYCTPGPHLDLLWFGFTSQMVTFDTVNRCERVCLCSSTCWILVISFLSTTRCISIPFLLSWLIFSFIVSPFSSFVFSFYSLYLCCTSSQPIIFPSSVPCSPSFHCSPLSLSLLSLPSPYWCFTMLSAITENTHRNRDVLSTLIITVVES